MQLLCGFINKLSKKSNIRSLCEIQYVCGRISRAGTDEEKGMCISEKSISVVTHFKGEGLKTVFYVCLLFQHEVHFNHHSKETGCNYEWEIHMETGEQWE